MQVRNGIVDHLYNRFKHVVAISPESSGSFWTDHRPLDEWCQANGCYWLADRALYDRWQDRWYSNSIGGGDYFFLATDDDEAAMLARMTWA